MSWLYSCKVVDASNFVFESIYNNTKFAFILYRGQGAANETMSGLLLPRKV